MNILMVSDDFLPASTGAGVHVQCISRALVQRGFRVTVITSRRSGEPKIQFWNGVKICRVFSVRAFGFYQALPSKAELKRIFSENEINLVHHHYLGFMMKRVCALAEELRIPQISTYHFGAEVLTQPWPMRPFRQLIQKQIIDYNNRVSCVISPSKKMAAQIANDGIRTVVRYISNPVSFQDTTQVSPAAREPGFTIFYAGRLSKEKNLSLLLKAFHLLTEQVPEARLWLAGDVEQMPIPEDSKLGPTNPYGDCKLLVEQIISKVANAESDWRMMILRYFNPAGAHASGQRDQKGGPFRRLLYLCS